MAMTGLLSAWVAEMVLIAYRGSKTGTTANNPIPHLAMPSEYASTFIIYGALAFIPGQGQKVASAIGWGLVAATFLNLWTPGTLVKPTAPSPTATNTAQTTNADTGVAQRGA
jgi:hypothetical protein